MWNCNCHCQAFGHHALQAVGTPNLHDVPCYASTDYWWTISHDRESNV